MGDGERGRRRRHVEQLEERIRRDGVVKSEGVLKVDSFLNHQLDIELFDAMGAEFKRLFADAPVTKILTIEASGIGIACVAARHFGVPVVFAKKAQSINLDGDMHTTRIQSFTHGRVYDVIVSKKFLGPDDHVLIIDDFLANGLSLIHIFALQRPLERREQALLGAALPGILRFDVHRASSLGLSAGEGIIIVRPGRAFASAWCCDILRASVR